MLFEIWFQSSAKQSIEKLNKNLNDIWKITLVIRDEIESWHLNLLFLELYGVFKSSKILPPLSLPPN